jgi:hypothetical protein
MDALGRVTETAWMRDMTTASAFPLKVIEPPSMINVPVLREVMSLNPATGWRGKYQTLLNSWDSMIVPSSPSARCTLLGTRCRDQRERVPKVTPRISGTARVSVGDVDPRVSPPRWR